MASNESPNPGGRAVWAVGAIALVLAACGGWLLTRPADAPVPTAGAPAESVPATLEPARPEAKVTAPATAAPSPATSPAAPVRVSRPSFPMSTTSPADELRKVQLALQGSATPKEMLEAATMLSACRSADMALESAYRMRDQQDSEGQQLDKASGVSKGEMLAWQQDFQRRCQVFDAATLARVGELFQRAYEGGAKDSALPYLQWLNGDGKQAARPELLGKLQREARQTAEDGDFIALLAYSYAFDPAPLGATPVQRQAYKEALFRIQGEQSGAAMEKASRTSMDNIEKMMSQWGGTLPPLSPEQQREADALTERVVEAWRKRQPKRG